MSFWRAISVVTLVRNRADGLDAALASLPGAAERIVADGGSRDGSPQVAERRGARVVAQDAAAIRAANGNFDVARDAAARKYATRPWLFYLDADERVSARLAEEIAGLEPEPDTDGFDIPRVNLFWGKPVRLLGEDRQLRLFRAGRGAYPGNALHEKVAVSGRVAPLRGALIHDNVRRRSDLLRLRDYVPIEARLWARRPTRWESWRAFDRRCSHYLITCGAWRDGWRGWFVSALYAAHHARVLRAARAHHV